MKPNRTKRLLAIVFFVFVVPAIGWCGDKEPGGQGSFTIHSYGYGLHCFKTKSATVQQVCADYTINWKLWTLMGEPVGDYNLAWTLDSIQLRDQRRNGEISFNANTLPKELQKAARAIELYIDGYATVNLTPIRHRFNTGVAVRAGAGSSYNVPGSPNWNNIFVYNSPCQPDAHKQWPVDAKTAKEEFKKGINLTSLDLCPNSGVSELTALEAAIDKLCSKPGADGKFAFCPKQKKEESVDKQGKKFAQSQSGLKEDLLDGSSSSSSNDSSVADLLDADAERPQVARKLAQLRATYRSKVEAACRSTMNEVNACYSKSNCELPADMKWTKEEMVCVEMSCGKEQTPNKHVGRCSYTSRMDVPMPFNVTKLYWHEQPSLASSDGRFTLSDSFLKFPKCWSEEVQNPNYAAWKACSEKAYHCRTGDACVKSCNPNRYADEAACVEQRMATSGPTEQDARAQLKQEWNAKAHAGNSAPAGKKAPQPATNFLD